MSPSQQVFLSWVTELLVDIVVLNLFVEFVDTVVIDSFAISILTAVLLKLMVDAVKGFEQRASSYFAAKPGAVWRTLRIVAVWLILFLSKFVICSRDTGTRRRWMARAYFSVSTRMNGAGNGKFGGAVDERGAVEDDLRRGGRRTLPTPRARPVDRGLDRSVPDPSGGDRNGVRSAPVIQHAGERAAGLHLPQGIEERRRRRPHETPTEGAVRTLTREPDPRGADSGQAPSRPR